MSVRVTTDGSGPVVRAEGLFHIYRQAEVETVALRGADLALEPGAWASIMGPSGSGKSTLIHVLAGLLEPNGGSVMFGGVDITRLAAAQRTRLRRRSIGLVLQRDNLHPLLDVAGNVALPLRLDGCGRREIRARVEELLRAVGLLDRRAHRPRELSGGEAQRAALAVALAPRPQVLLADEPTGNLDSRTTDEVLALLQWLNRDRGLTIVLVTHEPDVARCASRIVTVSDGLIQSDEAVTAPRRIALATGGVS
jgi:putative ABC transport system ATP-binding protein